MYVSYVTTLFATAKPVIQFHFNVFALRWQTNEDCSLPIITLWLTQVYCQGEWEADPKQKGSEEIKCKTLDVWNVALND